ncbi:MAG: N-acetyltransferase [Lysobacter sp.]|nr:N-acetyltransferase [Lysobacter sp.]
MPDIQHDAGHGRFSTTVDGELAYLDTRLDGDHLVITHTWVPDAIGGRGIAGHLVKAAFEHARAQGLKVRPACSYAAAWAERHPEFSDLLG